MIIVNTTFIIHGHLAQEVLEWIKTVYLRSAAHAGGTAPLVTRVLMPSPQDDVTYAVHVTFDTLADADKWAEGVGGALRQRLSERYGDRALAFHTYLEITE